MGLGRKVVLFVVGLFTIIYVTGILASAGFGVLAPVIGLAIGLLVPLVVHLLSIPRPQRPLSGQMSLAKFLGLLQVVALLAILYSPSTLRITLGDANATSTITDSFHAMAPFVKYLQSKYHVLIANDSQTLKDDLSHSGNKAYFLVGPDQGQNLSLADSNLIGSKYEQGDLSLFISEGNRTNNRFLYDYLLVSVKGDAILDPASQFNDKRVFTVTAHISPTPVKGVIDVASPIYHEKTYIVRVPGGPPAELQTNMRSVAESSETSTEAYSGFSIANTTVGPRSVIQVAQVNSSRVLLISDSSPFSTLYGRTFPTLGINETTFATRLADWVTNNDSNTIVIFDNYHYLSVPIIVHPSLSLNLSVGRLFAGALALLLSTANNSYDNFLANSRPFILGLALLTTWSLYGGLVKKYATEKRGKDDEPLPKIEKMIVAESEERRRFLDTVRDKGFYVAGLQQLYEVLDRIVQREFGVPISKISQEQLTQRLGPKVGLETGNGFSRLLSINRYAKGQSRFLYPPVLTWKRTAEKLAKQTEQFLNKLGLTMRDSPGQKGLDYRTRNSPA